MTTTTHGQGRQRVLAAIRAFIAQHGYSPSIRELVRLSDVASTSHVNAHLRRLRDEGAITYQDGTARTYCIVEK